MLYFRGHNTILFRKPNCRLLSVHIKREWHLNSIIYLVDWTYRRWLILITCMYPFCPKSYRKNKKYTNTIPLTFGMEGMYRFPFAIRKIVAIHNIPELFFRWSRDFSTSSKLLPKGVSVRNQKYDLISSVAASQNGDFVLTFQAAFSPEKKGLSRAKETLLWASLEKPS